MAVTIPLADNGIFAQSVSATFPATITANRVAINYDIVSAGSSSFSQTGVNFTLEPGYTGTERTFALTVKNGVATTLNMSVGLSGVCQAAGLSNCAVSGVSQNGTNGNIGVYGGIGGFTEGNFNFNITAAILASNGATGNDIYRGYSSTTLKFSVTDAGNVNIAGSFSGVNLATSGTLIDTSFVISVPVTLGTVVMGAGTQRLIINPAGTLAVLTVTLPSSPVNGQLAAISFTQAITSLTINAPGGATVVAPLTAAAIDTSIRFIYQASSTSWFPAG